MQLYHQAYGDGFPLIILHGFLGASGNWHSLSRNVFSKHFRVFSLDQRNHGRSPHADAFDYATLAADLATFMDEQTLDTAHIIGHSMGGKAAMQFALTYPDRVEKLVVADIAPRTYPPHHTTILAALRRLDIHNARSRSEVEAALAADIEDAGVRQFLLKNLASKPGGGYQWKMNLDVLYEKYPNVTEAIDGWPPFDRPALFIHGGASGYVSDADLPEIERLFPEYQQVTLPDAGHWIHAEAPGPFAEAVVHFLVD